MHFILEVLPYKLGAILSKRIAVPVWLVILIALLILSSGFRHFIGLEGSGGCPPDVDYIDCPGYAP